MKTSCSIAGCTRPAGYFSPNCETHRRNFQRNGHPLQTRLLVSELKPYRAIIQARRKANPESPAWGILEERWSRLVGISEGYLREWAAGRLRSRHVAKAAELVSNVAKSATPAEAVEVALAVYMLGYDRPARFKSDKALDFQAVKRLRALASMAAGTWWDHKRKKARGVYRIPSPVAVALVGGWLRDSFGGAGRQLIDLEHREKLTKEQKAEAERQRLYTALEALE